MFGKKKKDKRDSLFMTGITIAIQESLEATAKKMDLSMEELSKNFHESFHEAMSNHPLLHAKAEALINVIGEE